MEEKRGGEKGRYASSSQQISVSVLDSIKDCILKPRHTARIAKIQLMALRGTGEGG